MDLQLELNSSEDECKVACDAVPDHEDADGHGHGHSPSGGGLPIQKDEKPSVSDDGKEPDAMEQQSSWFVDKEPAMVSVGDDSIPLENEVSSTVVEKSFDTESDQVVHQEVATAETESDTSLAFEENKEPSKERPKTLDVSNEHGPQEEDYCAEDDGTGHFKIPDIPPLSSSDKRKKRRLKKKHQKLVATGAATGTEEESRQMVADEVTKETNLVLFMDEWLDPEYLPFLKQRLVKALSSYWPKAESPYFCEYCNFLSFRDAKMYDVHMKSKGHKRMFKISRGSMCQICLVNLASSSKMHDHCRTTRHIMLRNLVRKVKAKAAQEWKNVNDPKSTSGLNHEDNDPCYEDSIPIEDEPQSLSKSPSENTKDSSSKEWTDSASTRDPYVSDTRQRDLQQDTSNCEATSSKDVNTELNKLCVYGIDLESVPLVTSHLEDLCVVQLKSFRRLAGFMKHGAETKIEAPYQQWGFDDQIQLFKGLICQLCKRYFKTADQAKAHVRSSSHRQERRMYNLGMPDVSELEPRRRRPKRRHHAAFEEARTKTTPSVDREVTDMETSFDGTSASTDEIDPSGPTGPTDAVYAEDY